MSLMVSLSIESCSSGSSSELIGKMEPNTMHLGDTKPGRGVAVDGISHSFSFLPSSLTTT